MKDKLEKAVTTNAERASAKNVTADEALKFTQACANATNALACLYSMK